MIMVWININICILCCSLIITELHGAFSNTKVHLMDAKLHLATMKNRFQEQVFDCVGEEEP